MTLLATKYRPSKFSDLVGQDSARLILQSMVVSGDLPPAMTFKGTRGTGKTSAARIFASAINCDNQIKGDCCSECESCTSIRDGVSVSVHEIDAASNGGVAEIRSLRDLAQFSTGSRWRVILLDEAHSMSSQAFNALLKILEEPPPSTLFILLTTEPDKIMDTVQSRSMPIDFRPVSISAIEQRLKEICVEENIQPEEGSLTEIAESAGGGVRDAIMLLDQLHRVGSISVETVRSVTGKSNIASDLMKAIVTQNYVGAMSLTNDFFQTSGDSASLITDLIEQLQVRFVNNSISPKHLVASTKLLWEARRLIPRGASRDSRLQTQALVTLLYGAFYVEPKKPILQEKIQSSESVPSSSPLGSMEELAAIAGE